MTKEEKLARRNRRFQKRKRKMEDYKHLMGLYRCSLGEAKFAHKNGFFPPWEDADSSTGYSQYCDWKGTCPYPCNGDC